MSGRVVHGHGLVLPQDRRDAMRWALAVAPPCVVLGLAAGWVIGRWRHK